MRSPLSNLPITITVKLFAAYQEAEGLSELKLEFPKKTPVSQVLERLSAGPCSRIDRTGVGINQEFATRDAPLQNCDQVFLIAPVSYPPLPSDSPPMPIRFVTGRAIELN